MTILSKLGLMRVSEHRATSEAFLKDRKALIAELAAATAKNRSLNVDLAKLRERDTAQTDRIAQLKTWSRRDSEAIIEQGLELAALTQEIDELRPDAEAMRAKRKRDRDMKAAKRAAS